ncbi:hypothetical protein ACFL1H_05285 [Nanoarchaeota archaeon]
MKYERIDEDNIELILENENIKEVLLTIAKLSYEKALPRGMGFKQPYLHSNEKTPNFEQYFITSEEYIQTDSFLKYKLILGNFKDKILNNKKPKLTLIEGTKKVNIIGLCMDYINGRDCRTLVQKSPQDGKWYFRGYAFQQRGVSSDEFYNGIVRQPAEEFLDTIIQEL